MLSNRERVIIGSLVKQYRKEKNIAQKELAEGICSVTTLSKIENGCNVTDSLYEAILGRLNLYWEKSLSIQSDVCNRLYDCFLAYDADELNTIILGLQLHENNILERELTILLFDMYDYLENSKVLSKEKIRHYQELYNIYPLKMQYILFDMIFTSLALSNSLSTAISYIDTQNYLYMDVLVKINVIKSFVYQNKPIDAQRLITDCLRKEMPLERRYEIELLMVALYDNYQKEDLKDAMMAIYDKYSQINLHKSFRLRCELIVANILYKNRLYREAFDLYENCLQPRMYSHPIIMQCSIATKTNCMDYMRNIGKNIQFNTKYDEILLGYFRLKYEYYEHKIDITKLENYIYNNFHSFIYEGFYESIVEDELQWIVKESKNYNIKRIKLTKKERVNL